jgi:hypothetical protein
MGTSLGKRITAWLRLPMPWWISVPAAALLSFAIYGARFPIPVSNGGFEPWGTRCVHALQFVRMAAADHRDLACFLALGTLFALLLQAIVFLLGWLFFAQRRWWSLSLLVGVFAGTYGGLPRLISQELPAWIVTEPDRAPERVLPLECTLDVRLIPPYGFPVDLPDEEPWVIGRQVGLGLLRMPGCEIARLGDPGFWSWGLKRFAAPRGRMVFDAGQVPREMEGWWHSGGPKSSSVPCPQPTLPSRRILSNDGHSVAWLDEKGRRRNGSLELVLHLLSDGTESTRPLPFLPSVETLLGISLLGLDTEKGELTVLAPSCEPGGERRHPCLAEVSTFSLEGVRKWGPIRTGLEARVGTFRRIGDGWVAWEIPRDRGWIAWDLAAGAGRREALKWRRISAAGVDGSGRFIAVCESTALIWQMGSARPVVYVFRVFDGVEVFRRYLGWGQEVRVAFPGKGFFALSEEPPSAVQVFRLPVGD